MRYSTAEPFPQTITDMFRRCAAHLYKQNERAETALGDGCKYRMDDCELACPIGACIPDSAYDSDMDEGSNTCASEVMANFQESLGLHELADETFYALRLFANEIQEIHDHSKILDWRGELTELADKHEIDPAILNEAWPLTSDDIPSGIYD